MCCKESPERVRVRVSWGEVSGLRGCWSRGIRVALGGEGPRFF